jgi:hypothetical protein
MTASQTEHPTLIGRYEIRGILGEGTMGTVYHGWDSRLERNVAIKVLLPGSDTDATRADQIARFLREAKITSALKHPHIVEVYDIGEDPVTGISYLVMEFIKGAPLHQILKERQLTTREILTLICQVADGLDYAAQATVVHRDIKPANILVDPISLIPKLLDFGIAKREKTDVTHSGAIFGTPHYMSPEQCRGETVDTRSDLFSLGTVLYELLANRKAFPGETLVSVMTGILDPNKPIPPSEVRQGISAPVSEAVMKALAKNPADRFQRGKEFIAALEEALKMVPEAIIGSGGRDLRSIEKTMPMSAATSQWSHSAIQSLVSRFPKTNSTTRYVFIAIICAILALMLAVNRDWVTGETASREQAATTSPFVPQVLTKEVRKKEAPTIPFSINFGIIKEDQGKIILMNEAAALFPYDNFALILTPEQASFVYIWQIDSAGRVLRLFPNADFNDHTNPVPASKEVWLPSAKSRHHWFHLDLQPGNEEFVVVAAATPVAEVEKALKMLPMNGFADPTTNRIILKALLAAEDKLEAVRNITKAQLIAQKQKGVPTWSLKGASTAFSYRVILKHS